MRAGAIMAAKTAPGVVGIEVEVPQVAMRAATAAVTAATAVGGEVAAMAAATVVGGKVAAMAAATAVGGKAAATTEGVAMAAWTGKRATRIS